MTASTVETILAQLDACAANYCDFPMLDNAYIFPADVRLTLYRDRARWALALEALGFSPKAGDDADRIILNLHVFGNCLTQPPGLCATITPATNAAPLFADPWPGKLRPGTTLSLRGREARLPTDLEAYRAAGIERRSPPEHHPDLADDGLPSHTETFRQLAAVLCTGDPARYAPTEPPNTHWRHWPHGGDGVFFDRPTS